MRILGLFIFLMCSNANAGFLVEPYLGYAIGGSGDTLFSAGGTTYDLGYSGLQLGGRVGFSTLGFMAGIDYSLGGHGIDVKNTNSKVTTADEIDRSQLGVFVGYEFPILLRAWATYFLSAGVDGKGAPSANTTFDNTDEFTGSGMALGVGYTGLPFIALNLEYRSFSYDEYKSSGVKSSTFQKYETTEILLSVSAPFNF